MFKKRMEALSRMEQSGVNPVGVGISGAGSSFLSSSSSSVVSNLEKCDNEDILLQTADSKLASFIK